MKKNLSESQLEKDFLNLIQSHNIPPPTQQFIFHPIRKWRFDFAWPKYYVAVEIQGVDPKQSALHGIAHNSILSMKRDYEKHNEAIHLNWKILYFLGVDLEHPNSINTINLLSRVLNVTPTKQQSQSSNNTKVKHWNANIDQIRRGFDQMLNQKVQQMYSS